MFINYLVCGISLVFLVLEILIYTKNKQANRPYSIKWLKMLVIILILLVTVFLILKGVTLTNLKDLIM